jgi:hypothetical protein
VLNRFWLCVWFIGVAANLGVVAVFSYNAELNSVKKEVRGPLRATTAKTKQNRWRSSRDPQKNER